MQWIVKVALASWVVQRSSIHPILIIAAAAAAVVASQRIGKKERKMYYLQDSV
jgi:hypothetical protein